MPGRRKFRRDQSSARLFWRGVPVSSSLLLESYAFRHLPGHKNKSFTYIYIQSEAIIPLQQDTLFRTHI